MDASAFGPNSGPISSFSEACRLLQLGAQIKARVSAWAFQFVERDANSAPSCAVERDSFN